MANHKSAEKRIRANETKRVRNRYQAKTTRTQIKKLTGTTKKDEAAALLKEVSGMGKACKRVSLVLFPKKYFSLSNFGWGGFFCDQEFWKDSQFLKKWGVKTRNALRDLAPLRDTVFFLTFIDENRR